MVIKHNFGDNKNSVPSATFVVYFVQQYNHITKTLSALYNYLVHLLDYIKRRKMHKIFSVETVKF